MKKCNIYLDFVNSDSFDEKDCISYKDVLKHAETCADCSFDRKIREQMLSSLSNQPLPDYPENLHDFTMSSLTDEGTPIFDNSRIGSLFMNLLKPLEIAVPAACIVMLFFMIQLNSNNDFEKVQPENNSLQKIRIAEARDNINEEGLQKVSSEEVEEFLAKLDEFQKLHPESKTMHKIYKPEVRLVGDR